MTTKLQKIFIIKNNNHGFTLIELLVVISIIAILVGVSIFGLSGARESARDARRKSDLELIRSGLELYKADCNRYPATQTGVGANLIGSVPPTSCAILNTYITGYPDDPITGRDYRYSAIGSIGYEICASLEQGTGTQSCGGSSTCGSATCNYKVTNP